MVYNVRVGQSMSVRVVRGTKKSLHSSYHIIYNNVRGATIWLVRYRR
jgi:hypothetical protein